jgi:mannosyltransferase OCH1-like enzyme
VEKSTNPKLQQRTIKICPHHYLPDIYDIAIYVDAIVIPNMTAVDAMINVILHNPINMIHVNHPCRKKITEEATVVVKSKLEHNHNVQMILDMHKKDNFKDDVGLTETALLIRKYKNIINFSEEWLKCVTICIRDQISFNYILWKHHVSSLCLDNSQKQIYNKDLHSEYTCKYKRIKCK